MLPLPEELQVPFLPCGIPTAAQCLVTAVQEQFHQSVKHLGPNPAGLKVTVLVQ